MSQIENSLRRAIAELILGTRDLRSLATLVAQTIATVDASDRGAESLAFDLELRLAEYSNGDWTLEELKDLLRPLVTNYAVGRSEPVMDSDVRVTIPEVSATLQFVDIRREGVLV
jgi:hypothetical protein